MGKFKTKLCDECTRPAWKGGKCRVHQEPSKENEGQDASIRAAEMLLFFMRVWEERCDRRGDCYCYETGYRMVKEKYKANMACYHHLLSKELYPEYKFNKENIVIVLPETHYELECNLEKAPQVKQLTEILKLKHKNGLITDQSTIPSKEC